MPSLFIKKKWKKKEKKNLNKMSERLEYLTHQYKGNWGL